MIKLIQLKSGLMDTLGDVYCIEIHRHVDDTSVFLFVKKGEPSLSTTGVWNHTGHDKVS